jgi:hypothetical protein
VSDPPSEDEVYNDAVKSFREAYRESEEASKKTGWAIGKEAIENLADQVRKGPVKPPQQGFMVFFSLKLGVRRALDYAQFLPAERSTSRGAQDAAGPRVRPIPGKCGR